MRYDRTETCPTVKKFLWYNFFILFSLKKIYINDLSFFLFARPFPSKSGKAFGSLETEKDQTN